jgi:hypothetical protein
MAMRLLLPGLLSLAVACGSTPQNPYRPSVQVEQLSAMSFGATTAAPVAIEVQVANRSQQPMTVKIVRIEGGLSQQYVVRPVERVVTELIPPGETRAVRLTITAVSQQGRINDPEPLNLRGFVTYRVGEQQFQDLYIFRSIMQ